MFDKAGMGGMFGALGDQMRKMQEQVAQEEVEGSVAGGKLRVRVNGAQEVLAVRIDPSLMDDREMLEDLLTAATNDALRRSKEIAAQKMSAFASSLGLPPGLL
jgi:DNA-binding YbaB/EbfC family protein